MSLTERVIELVVWWTATIAAITYAAHRIGPRRFQGQTRAEQTTNTTKKGISA
jgi:hypothetical protein